MIPGRNPTERAREIPVLLALTLLPAFLPWGPAWLRMGVAGFGLLAGTKAWITWIHLRGGSRFPDGTIGLWALWPGMDPIPFTRHATVDRPRRREIAIATAAGAGAAILALGILPKLADEAPEIRGWTGMLLLVLTFHFGGFGLMAAWLQRRGHPVEPVMGAVWKAGSLTEFWGRLWNRPFRDAANRLLFRPAARRWGVPGATLFTFLVSGLIHEAVITVPAQAAHGGPTAYFLTQAAGLLWERHEGAATRGPAGWARRIRTWLFLLLPLPWLFPRPFAARVLAPLIDLLSLK